MCPVHCSLLGLFLANLCRSSSCCEIQLFMSPHEISSSNCLQENVSSVCGSSPRSFVLLFINSLILYLLLPYIQSKKNIPCKFLIIYHHNLDSANDFHCLVKIGLQPILPWEATFRMGLTVPRKNLVILWSLAFIHECHTPLPHCSNQNVKVT